MTTTKELALPVKMAIQAYTSDIERAAHSRKWLLQNGHGGLLKEIERTGVEPEDILIRNQELVLMLLQAIKEIKSLRKLFYTSSVQNCPSTGQPMTEEQFFKVMGWVEKTDERQCGSRAEYSELPDSDL